MNINNRLRKPLPAAEERVLEAMFNKHQELIVKSAFNRGRSGSRVYLVRPVRPDGPELPAVVKIDHVERIRQEWQAYQEYIQDKLPGVAEIRGEPVYPPGNPLAGLLYPLAGEGAFDVVSLSDYYRQASLENIRYVLESRLFRTLGTIWKQTKVQPDLHLQQYYDAFLPANLVIASEPLSPDASLHQLDPQTARWQTAAVGDTVQLVNFQVVRVYREVGILVLDVPPGQPGAYRLQIGPVENVEDYEAEQVLSRPLTGRVAQTRAAFLQEQTRAVLGPAVNLAAATLSLPRGVTLPNPLAKLPELLDRSFDAYVACIHADLNLENILVEPANRNTYLIDFVNSRRDHVLRDLLHLEMAVVTWLLPEALAGARLAAEAVFDLYQWLHCALQGVEPTTVPAGLAKPFAVLRTIRQAAQRYLFEDGQWDEYYCGLVLYLLGALRYRDLDEPQNTPAPKAVAFWAAATTLQLLDSRPACQQQVDDKPVVNKRITLRQMMAEHFSLEELRTLCYDLHIEFDDLSGSGKEGKIRALITYCERRGRVEDLVDACRKQRENVNW
ncbi:MAG: aminoglycoside phosphotransferase family protein [Chloroflexi bacterium]|nr:aminoglycoside phosphotransferase family protein [Chloroflexota bacterium]MCI0644108.1 aminoglycoside phosphotransferase family protein [Chloroflexota bacterium]MCI0730679.1 aminoglycoside phosphotransferase family protein [Chloroflexota bacterium]